MRLFWTFLITYFSFFTFSRGDSFNFEISNHVLDVVQKILDTGTWPNSFSKRYFESGYANGHDLNNTGSMFYFLLLTILNARNVYMGWEDGSFVSVIRGTSAIPTLKANFNLSGEYLWSFMPPGGPLPKIRYYYETDTQGRPTTFLKSQQYDHRTRPWYMAAKKLNTSLWYGPLVYYTLAESGITFCTPVYLPNGALDGILALDFALVDISSFLKSQYEYTDRQVYIVDTQGYLIGSSTGIDLLINADSQMVTANASSDPKLTQINDRMAENNFQEGLIILDSSYVQSAVFKDNTSLDWRIWVSMPAAPTKDFLLFSDSGAIPVLVISAIACAVSITALGFVIWYREAKIIRMSQRRLVGTFLTGCLLLNLSFIAYLGSNTTEECRFRSWWPNLMFTLAFAPILVKTWYMYSVFTKKMSNMKSKNHPRFSPEWWKGRFVGLTARTLALILVEVIILLCATFTGEMDPYTATVLGPDGAYQTRTFCGPEGEGPFNLLDLIYKVGMVGVGCVLAFATRHISSFLAESYSLAVIVYSISVFGLIVLLITKTTALEIQTSFLLRTLGVCWSTTVSTIALLGPRFYKLLTIGDEAAMQWLRKGPLSNQPSDHVSASGTLSIDRPVQTGTVDRVP